MYKLKSAKYTVHPVKIKVYKVLYMKYIEKKSYLVLPDG
jgi:hypothetical protein